MVRVLVVDDEANVREMVTRCLEHEGYQVNAVANGAEAVDALNTGGVDLVIIDAYMPHMDGIGLLTYIAKSRERPKIIAISGGGYLDSETILEIASRMGATRTLEKPFTVDQLLQCVRDQVAGQS